MGKKVIGSAIKVHANGFTSYADIYGVREIESKNMSSMMTPSMLTRAKRDMQQVLIETVGNGYTWVNVNRVCIEIF